MRNNTFFKIFFIFLILEFAAMPSRLRAEQDIFERFLDQLKKETVQTGDLVFWALNQTDSVLIQKVTEGAYSHAGIVWVDEEGKIWIFDVSPEKGLSRDPVESHFEKEKNDLVSLAFVRYQGQLNRREVEQRLKEFWARKNQIKFDHSLALEEGGDYTALLKGDSLSLYCTEFVYRVYDGVFSGPSFFENDYQRIYTKRELLKSADAEGVYELQRLLGIQPEVQFEKWLMSHKSQVLITANGILRGGGFEVLFEVQDRERLQPWAKRFLQRSETKSKDEANS